MGGALEPPFQNLPSEPPVQNPRSRTPVQNPPSLYYSYIYAGSCSYTDLPTGTSPGPPLNMSSPIIHP